MAHEPVPLGSAYEQGPWSSCDSVCFQVLENCLTHSRHSINIWRARESVENPITKLPHNGTSLTWHKPSTHTHTNHSRQAQQWIKYSPPCKSEWWSSLIHTELRDPRGSQSQGWQGLSSLGDTWKAEVALDYLIEIMAVSLLISTVIPMTRYWLLKLNVTITMTLCSQGVQVKPENSKYPFGGDSSWHPFLLSLWPGPSLCCLSQSHREGSPGTWPSWDSCDSYTWQVTWGLGTSYGQDPAALVIGWLCTWRVSFTKLSDDRTRGSPFSVSSNEWTSYSEQENRTDRAGNGYVKDTHSIL